MKKTLLFALLVTVSSPAFAQIGAVEGVRSVLGESGPSFEEMHALSHAIRNRGHLGGVYGLHRVNDRFEERAKNGKWVPIPESKVQLAMKAWTFSDPDPELSQPDPTHGADHWLSDWDLAHARKELIAFRFEMVETAYIGTTHFYRSRRK